MRKLAIIVTITICVSGLANATDVIIELKAHYFTPSEKAFQDIYGGGLMYGVEMSIGVWKDLYVWLGGSYFSKQGELTFTEEETNFELLPLGGGVKYRLLSGNIALYVGLGLSYYLYKETNPIDEVTDGALGYIGKIGSYVRISERLLIDAYLDYSYCKIKPADFDINIGGIEAGVGLGFKF